MTEPQRAVLVVEDEEITRENLEDELLREGYRVATAADGRAALDLLREQVFDVVLTDLKMEGMSGNEVIKTVKENWPDVEVIVITGYASLDSAVETVKMGAYDYIAKPFQLANIRRVVSKAIEKRGLLEENRRLRRELEERYRFSEIIGKSAKMQEVFNLINKVAETDASILITGETGTGKELVARAIHYNSRRRNKPFISVNCGALTEDLLTNELFGHEKGAFTGAVALKRGLLEAADGGTVFLDEITETSPSMQVKLLRFLQEKEIIRVGGTESIKLDVRVLAATNRNPRRAVERGTFRVDLYYRLNVLEIHMPPLAERKDDIPLLVQHFIDKSSEKVGKRIRRIDPEALNILIAYNYPGNVRELENIIERAVVLAGGDVITAQDLPRELVELEISTERDEAVPLLSLEETERRHIDKVLKSTGYNRTLAARILGLDRSTLWRKMKKYGL